MRAATTSRTAAALSLLVAALLALGGCATGDVNPLFPISVAEAQSALAAMRESPLPLERPVVVLGGIHDPGFAAPGFARTLRAVTTEDARVLPVSFFTCSTFDSCRRRVVEAVNEAWPSDDPGATIEVDAIGISMGGLVARYAARRLDDGAPRLRIRRLYTIATPHLGARMANIPTLDDRIIDMRAGSAFLFSLNDVTRAEDPEIIPYGRLGDMIVGVENTAPPGRDPWWVPNRPLTFAHLTVSHDPRIVADILRRLRREPPLTVDPVTGAAPDPRPGSGDRDAP